MSLETTVQRLQDRLDIQELLAGYCRHADLLDAQGMVDYFTDDCIVSYVPPSMGSPPPPPLAPPHPLNGSPPPPPPPFWSTQSLIPVSHGMQSVSPEGSFLFTGSPRV